MMLCQVSCDSEKTTQHISQSEEPLERVDILLSSAVDHHSPEGLRLQPGNPFSEKMLFQEKQPREGQPIGSLSVLTRKLTGTLETRKWGVSAGTVGGKFYLEYERR